jgi:hypothetical protein
MEVLNYLILPLSRLRAAYPRSEVCGFILDLFASFVSEELHLRFPG